MGDNAQGKTNVLEAIAWLATGGSFRGAQRDSVIRHGFERAVLRAGASRGGRDLLIETEIARAGRERVQVNRQRLGGARQLLDHLRVSVFSPEDIALVKGDPAARRRLLDDGVVALRPRAELARAGLERVLRQRSALLKQAGGRLAPDIRATLEVWDSQLARLGGEVVAGRERLVGELQEHVERSYSALAQDSKAVSLRYVRSWEGDLADAIAAAREEDVRRALTSVGPHRDDLAVLLAGLPARSQASQGEQRSLALALRLGLHRLVTEELGEAPVLLLDDVFSELDPGRAERVLAQVPAGQAMLTTTGPVPPAALVAARFVVCEGRISEPAGVR